jgi:hypothetical protein
MAVSISVNPQKLAWPQLYNIAHSEQLATLGEKIRTANAEFQYIKFTEAVDGYAGMCSYWVDGDPTAGYISCDVSANGGSIARCAGVLLCAMTANKFGWILKKGGPMSLYADVLNTVAEANGTADAPVATPAIGLPIIPAAVTDGKFAYLLQEEGDSSDQDVASLEASIEKMQQNMPRICGRMSAIGTGVQKAFFNIPDW